MFARVQVSDRCLEDSPVVDLRAQNDLGVHLDRTRIQPIQMLSEFAIASTTMTVKKVDGSTALMTFTLDDDTNPTSLTRAT